METEIDYNKMCEVDAAHQREWREFFEKCFNEKGELIENKESKAVLEKITERKTKKNSVLTVAKQNNQSKTFG